MKKRVTCKCPNKIDACKKMLYIIIHDSRPVGVMTSAVDAAMLAKPLAGATVFSCHPNSTDVSECDALFCHRAGHRPWREAFDNGRRGSRESGTQEGKRVGSERGGRGVKEGEAAAGGVGRRGREGKGKRQRGCVRRRRRKERERVGSFRARSTVAELLRAATHTRHHRPERHGATLQVQQSRRRGSGLSSLLRCIPDRRN